MSRSNLLNPPRKLPDITLRDAVEGVPVRLRPAGDRSALIVMIHPECAACRAWIARLAEQHQEMATWKGDVKLITREHVTSADLPFLLLLDPESQLASALGLTHPAVVVADQWGEIHEASEAGEDHRFLPIESLVEWVRHLATECPECQGEAY